MSEMPDVIYLFSMSGDTVWCDTDESEEGQPSFEYVSAEKAKSDLHEKLRQQREACAKAWSNAFIYGDTLQDCEDAILIADIDNNGEDE